MARCTKRTCRKTDLFYTAASYYQSDCTLYAARLMKRQQTGLQQSQIAKLLMKLSSLSWFMDNKILLLVLGCKQCFSTFLALSIVWIMCGMASKSGENCIQFLQCLQYATNCLSVKLCPIRFLMSSFV